MAVNTQEAGSAQNSLTPSGWKLIMTRMCYGQRTPWCLKGNRCLLDWFNEHILSNFLPLHQVLQPPCMAQPAFLDQIILEAWFYIKTPRHALCCLLLSFPCSGLSSLSFREGNVQECVCTRARTHTQTGISSSLYKLGGPKEISLLPRGKISIHVLIKPMILYL